MRVVFFQPTKYTECQAFYIQSSELAPTPRHPQESVAPPAFGPKGGGTLSSRGGGGADSDDGTDTLEL
jgi:hypothetical protein